MIITRQRSIDKILNDVRNFKKLCLVGCSLCATTCKTGGEKDLDKIFKLLQESGKEIVGKFVLDPACSAVEVKRFREKRSEDLKPAQAIVSFGCGAGTQTVAEVFNDMWVYPGTDAIFQGGISSLSVKGGRFEQKCSMCGQCVLTETAGICPVTRCPKEMVNGPCGGSKNGKCEVDADRKCTWLAIYDRLNERKDLSGIKKFRHPKDHSICRKPQVLEV